MKAEVNFWLPEYQENEYRIRNAPWTIETIGSLAPTTANGPGVKDGPGGWLIKKSEYVQEGVPVIRAMNVIDGKVDLAGAVFITAEKNEELSSTQVRPGDLLLTMRGSIGRAAIVPDTIDTANINAAICRIRLRDQGLNQYVRDFLNTQPGLKQSLRHGHKAVQGDLNLDAVRSFVVPVPPQEVRNRLVTMLEENRKKRSELTDEADGLLAGLDQFVLKQLRVSLPPRTERLVYAIRRGDVTTAKKLYPDYFHPERTRAVEAIAASYGEAASMRLSDIAHFHRVQRQLLPSDDYLGLANVQSNTGERVESREQDGEGTVSEYSQDDVLFARLRPYLNKVYRAERDGVCSPEFHVIRVRREKDGSPLVLPDYLAAVLRSSIVLAQTRHMMTGNTHPRLANDDVVNLVVPIADNDVQRRIADEVWRRRCLARRLRANAEALWVQAQARFEEELLGSLSEEQGR